MVELNSNISRQMPKTSRKHSLYSKVKETTVKAATKTKEPLVLPKLT